MGNINISQKEEVLSFSFSEVFVQNNFIKDDDELYISDVDFITDDDLYRGEAVPGTGTSAALWRIRHITIAGDGDVTTRFADGNTNFDNVWDDRISLSYS